MNEQNEKNEQIAVQHNQQQQCFEIVLQGHRAQLDYRPIGDNKLDFYHTFVPNELRGKGLAALLTEAALNYAKQASLEVIPSCSYVAVYLKRKGS